MTSGDSQPQRVKTQRFGICFVKVTQASQVGCSHVIKQSNRAMFRRFLEGQREHYVKSTVHYRRFGQCGSAVWFGGE